jgi:hypothetical protein
MARDRVRPNHPTPSHDAKPKDNPSKIDDEMLSHEHYLPYWFNQTLVLANVGIILLE